MLGYSWYGLTCLCHHDGADALAPNKMSGFSNNLLSQPWHYHHSGYILHHTYYFLAIGKTTVGPVIMQSICFKNPHNSHPISWPLGSVVRTKSHICNVWTTAVLYEISCYIGPHYNGSWLYVGEALGGWPPISFLLIGLFILSEQ